ncbi:MAG: PLD nuclease N-terminal domain-containing protein [Candidatus Zipacnadales bacterium]
MIDPASILWFTFVGTLTVATAVWIIGVVDCAYRKFDSRGEKWAWLALVILGHWLGVVIYWCLGRERGSLGPV